MNTITEKDIYKLQEIKNKIKDKEDTISESQRKQNKLEARLKKLKQQKEKITNNKSSFLRKLIFYIIYDIVMLSILILFMKYSINKLELIKSLELILYIINIYVGVITICVSGAFVSSKIELLIKKHYDKKRLLQITKKIKEKEEKITIEKNIQEEKKKEITNTINNLNEDEKQNYKDNDIDKEPPKSQKKYINQKKIRIRKL